jgi:hypothetical protein
MTRPIITKFDALDAFSITRRKPAPKLRQYLITWPCGSTWQFDRTDLDVPEYRDGDQNGVTCCFDTVREAIDCLQGLGCKVELLS